jgi:hypothetical protein
VCVCVWGGGDDNDKKQKSLEEVGGVTHRYSFFFLHLQKLVQMLELLAEEEKPEELQLKLGHRRLRV